MTTETQLQSDVDALKAKISDTPALYAKVCALLFFDYGITPTTNKLYQLVRRGSMGVPTKALQDFWIALRSRAKVDVVHPELPDELREMAGQVVASLWGAASERARSELAVLADESRQAVVQMQGELAVSRSALDDAQEVLASARQSLDQRDQALALTDGQLQAQRVHVAELTARLEERERQLNEKVVQAERQKKEFESKLMQQAEDHARALSEEKRRSQEEQRRLLLDVDRWRTANTALDKQIEAMRTAGQETEARRQQEILNLTGTNARLTAELKTALRDIETGKDRVVQAEQVRDAAQLQAAAAAAERDALGVRARVLEELLNRAAEDRSDPDAAPTSQTVQRKTDPSDMPDGTGP
jgi:chromosome segregation ATPase